MSKEYDVNIRVVVTDARALFEAALERTAEDGLFDTDEEARKFLETDGLPDVGRCLLTLLDPSSVPPDWGFEILDSSVSEPGQGLPRIACECEVPEYTPVPSGTPKDNLYFVPMFGIVSAPDALEAERIAAESAAGTVVMPDPLGAIEIQGPAYTGIEQLATVDVHTRVPDEEGQ